MNNVQIQAPVISSVKVVGNKATVILSGESNGASGYDYVISKANDYSTERVDVTKNQIKTTGDFKYVQQGTYYAYLIFMKRYSVTIVMDSEPEEVVMTCAAPLGELGAQLHLGGSMVLGQRLLVGVHCDEFDALQAVAHHAVDCVAAAAAYALSLLVGL